MSASLRAGLAAAVCGLLAAAAACSGAASSGGGWRAPSGGPSAPLAGGSVRSFDLTAAPLWLPIGSTRMAAWAYNGTVPGPLLRVKAGDLVRVTLHNRLPASTSVHFHGLAVPNGEDGVPGVTQDAIPPGATATYSFLATSPGTYWYHSHEDSAAQVDRGLYGALVVDDPAAPAAAADETLVYDEWPLGLERASPPPEASLDMDSYDAYSVNGRSGDGVAPVTYRPGETLRLRLVNAGYQTHYLWLRGATATISEIGGRPVSGAGPVTGTIALAAGDRVALDVLGPPGGAWLTLADGDPHAAAVAVPLVPEGGVAPPRPAAAPAPPLVDLYALPAASARPVWPVGAWPAESATLRFSEDYRPKGGPQDAAGVSYLIDGRAYPAAAPLMVSRGDLVQLTLVNAGRVQHPIHLHGHTMQLLSRNGAPLPGTILVDTVLVEPGSTVVVGFRADNPGWWMLHCHMLQHAHAGMMMLLGYRGAGRMATEHMGSMPD